MQQEWDHWRPKSTELTWKLERGVLEREAGTSRRHLPCCPSRADPADAWIVLALDPYHGTSTFNVPGGRRSRRLHGPIELDQGIEAGEGAGREAADSTGSIWGIMAASHFLCA